MKFQEEAKEAAKEREQKEAVAMETAVATKEEVVSTEVRNLQSQLKSALEEKASMETQLEGKVGQFTVCDVCVRKMMIMWIGTSDCVSHCP